MSLTTPRCYFSSTYIPRLKTYPTSLVAAISDPAIRQAFMTVIQVDDQWAQ